MRLQNTPRCREIKKQKFGGRINSDIEMKRWALWENVYSQALDLAAGLIPDILKIRQIAPACLNARLLG